MLGKPTKTTTLAILVALPAAIAGFLFRSYKLKGYLELSDLFVVLCMIVILAGIYLLVVLVLR